MIARSVLIPILEGPRPRPVYEPIARLMIRVLGDRGQGEREWTASPVFATADGGLAVRATVIGERAWDALLRAVPLNSPVAWAPRANSRDAEFAIGRRRDWSIVEEQLGAPAAPLGDPVIVVRLGRCRFRSGARTRDLAAREGSGEAAPFPDPLRLIESWRSSFRARLPSVEEFADSVRIVGESRVRVHRAPSRTANEPGRMDLVCDAELRLAVRDRELRAHIWRLAGAARFAGTGTGPAKGDGLTWAGPDERPASAREQGGLAVLRAVWRWHGAPANLEPVRVERVPGEFVAGKSSR